MKRLASSQAAAPKGTWPLLTLPLLELNGYIRPVVRGRRLLSWHESCLLLFCALWITRTEKIGPDEVALLGAKGTRGSVTRSRRGIQV